ncbi:PH domain-containing protein [Streptomyces sp. 6-11-2]|uniref:PH domain-containing protein n=1 Tax=Streptomyces sp. 6-11-2 TaxID=2585753 RepID=UPI00114401D9|nr:PH domain-containing protein [Streptomyces sp. 6-11-2]GED85548.1 membrane protein [Streptomyces sp. 6-11-2]
MADVWNLTCRPRWRRALWPFVRVSADARGLHVRTLLRRQSVPWGDIAELRVQQRPARTSWTHTPRRVTLVPHYGREWLLPLPRSRSSDAPDFDAEVKALRALHRRHAATDPGKVPAVSYGTTRHGWAGALVLCPVLLVFAAMAALSVSGTASDEQAWKSATACTARTPAAERRECLTATPAVISRTEDSGSRRQPNWLYFTDGRPLERVKVSRDAVLEFRAGDHVELTFWRGRVMKVAGKSYAWHENVATAGATAVFAAAFALAACYAGAHSLLGLLGRRLRNAKDLPPALPFAGALAATALWLLPLCYLHPTTLFSSPAAITWLVVGSLVTLGLFIGAWHTTTASAPDTATGKSAAAEAEEEFLPARFLEDTDYNPHGFGTHIVLDGGPLAVAPGPGRFAAKPIPVQRLTLKNVRRARGSDPVDRHWDVAELDDAGTPVRLAAEPADLARILRELALAKTSVNTVRPGP